MTNRLLAVIVGPTAIGKTEISISIAKQLGTEIISCDSRQIYNEMKIGTARPAESQLKEVRHHFIASISINDYYNASMFEFAVINLLDELFKNNRLVVMTGGSGLYADAVCKGIDDLPTIEPEIRTNLLKRLKDEGVVSLRQELSRIDPDYWQTADIKNPKRILKALEVYYMTGQPYSKFLTKNTKDRDFKIIKIGLNRERKELYEIIDQRVDSMIKNGLIDEALSLYQFRNLNALNTVGYKELFDYFDEKHSLEKAIELIKRNTRRFAKRQLSWFARDKEIVWFHPEQKNEVWDYINSKLNE
jgi:tRNA dimethylallyltransferase